MPVCAGVSCMVLLCCLVLVVFLKARAGHSRKLPLSTKLSLDDATEESAAIKSDSEPDVVLVSASQWGYISLSLHRKSQSCW